MSTTTTTNEPAITFATTDEYEAQCERCTQEGIWQAAGRVWDVTKAKVTNYWRAEEALFEIGILPIDAARRIGAQLEVLLDVLDALDVDLGVQFDHLPGTDVPRPRKVRASWKDSGAGLGCIQKEFPLPVKPADEPAGAPTLRDASPQLLELATE